MVSAFYHFEWSVEPYIHLGLFTFSIFKYHCLEYQIVLCLFQFRKFMRRRIVYCICPYFCFFCCSFFLPDAISFLLLNPLLYVWRRCFSHFLRVILPATSSFSFLSCENVLISPLFLKDSFVRYKIHGWKFFFFFNTWKMFHFFLPSWFQMRNLRNLLSFKLVFSIGNAISVWQLLIFFFVFSFQKFNDDVS